MKRNPYWSLLLLALFVAGPVVDAIAADIKVVAQVRWRLEADAKDFNGNTAADVLSLQRTRLGVRFESDSNVNAFVQLQDARVWGTETHTLRDASADAFDLHQGYFVVNNLFDQPLALKVGRMELAYGNQRLVGAVGWSNTGRSFDGVVMGVKKERLELDVWATTLRDSSLMLPPGERDRDQYFFGAYGAVDWGDGANSTEFFGMYDLDRDTIPMGDSLNVVDAGTVGDNILSRFTVGAVHKVRFSGFEATLEASYQLGSIVDRYTTEDTLATGEKVDATVSSDIAAYMFAANVGYVFAGARGKPWVGAGVDVLSGDDNLADGDFKQFNTLYATGHKWYGYMDYFPALLGGYGLIDVSAKAKVEPADNTTFAVDFHRFMRAQEDPAKEKTFGNEVDATVTYKYNDNAAFQAGFSIFLPGEVFETMGREDKASWFYFMATANL